MYIFSLRLVEKLGILPSRTKATQATSQREARDKKHENPERQQSTSIKWIKPESGNPYICRVGALDGIDNPTEAEFQRLCQDESATPQND